MPSSPTAVLPKRIPHAPHLPTTAIGVSPLLLDAAATESDSVLQKLRTSKTGLSRQEVEKRWQEFAPNVVAREQRNPRLRLLAKAMINPLVILLLVLAASSFLTEDVRSGSIILLMVVLGVVLRFVQEARADTAAAKLQAMISVHATVIRDGQSQEVPIGRLVPSRQLTELFGDRNCRNTRLTFFLAR